MTRMRTEGVRLLQAGDAVAAVAVIHAAFGQQSAVTDPPSAALRETAATVGRAIAEGGGAGVAAEGVLVAVVLWAEQGDGLYCGRLAVRPGWRGRGLARRLLAAADGEARRRGLACLRVSTRLVLADNRRLFASCGFREGAVATHAGYAAPTSVTMEKPLPSADVGHDGGLARAGRVGRC